MKKIICCMVVVCALLVVAGSAEAVNWEIVSVIQKKEGYVMKMKDPQKVVCDLEKSLTKHEMAQITDYFGYTVEQTSAIVGYQFIDDPAHVGIIKAICTIKGEAILKAEMK